MEEENIIQWSFMDEAPEDNEIRKQFNQNTSSGGALDPMGIRAEGHKRQFEDCIMAVETGGKPLVDGYEAAKAVALVEAMYKSAASGTYCIQC